MKAIHRTFLVVSVVFSATANADLASELSNFWNDMSSGMSNVTSPDYVKTQEAGYMTLGNLSYRVPNRTYQLASVTLPSASAGCGGIDMHLGGFGFINADGLISAYRNIAAAAPAMAFKLALASVTPMLEKGMSELQKIANEVNSLAVNSCEEAEGLVGFGASKMGLMDRDTCKSYGTYTGVFSDQSEAMSYCGDEAQVEAVAANARANPALKDTEWTKYNLAWRALKAANSPWLNSDEMTFIAISLTGTIVKNGDKAEPFPPLGLDKAWLQSVIGIGLANNASATVPIYRCTNAPVTTGGNDGCLDLKKTSQSSPLTLAYANTFYGKARTRLASILETLRLNTTMGIEDRQFIQTTPLPIYKILNVLAASGLGDRSGYVDALANTVATEMAESFLDSVMSTIRAAGSNPVFPEEQTKTLARNIDKVGDEIRSLGAGQREKLAAYMDMMQNISSLEKSLYMRMAPNLMSSINFGASVK